MKKLWLVGQWRRGRIWEFQGVFSTKSKAIAACRNWRYFVAPVVLNEELPDESLPMPGEFYPIARTWKDK